MIPMRVSVEIISELVQVGSECFIEIGGRMLWACCCGRIPDEKGRVGVAEETQASYFILL